MNASLQLFVSGEAVLNRTLAQAEKLVTQASPIINEAGAEVLGLYALAEGQGAPQGTGPQGAFTLGELQADPFDLGPADSIHFLLGIQYGATIKLVDVGPSLDILNKTDGTTATTRIEEFLGEGGIGDAIGKPANPAMLVYNVCARDAQIQAAIAARFGMPVN